jgi:NAD-dependent dihydropyrimidine dehydrogenase PreA subunit
VLARVVPPLRNPWPRLYSYAVARPGDHFRCHKARTEGVDAMTYVITEACIGVKDRACVDVCPVDCIYEGEDMLYIHPDECIDCGACEPECPVSAIFPEEDVPANLTSYIEKNKEVFNSDTPPGRPKR